MDDEQITPNLWREAASRVGARLGNWNDRRNTYDRRGTDAFYKWKRIDRIASWLYIRPDCGKKNGSPTGDPT